MQEQTDTFYTISGFSKGLFKEKKSKFMAFAFPVSNEEEIKKYLAGLRKEFYDARHHCYAYILGYKKDLFRVDDDKEPSGTAGKPILGQIMSRKLTNVLVVVVRYFGGTLLGTGGLIKAYGNAAADALNKASIVEKTTNSTFRLTFGYQVLNIVMQIIKEEKAVQLNQIIDTICEIEFSVRNSRTKIIEEKLKRINTLKYNLTKN
jgi:uncharacterized YigZ family protein